MIELPRRPHAPTHRVDHLLLATLASRRSAVASDTCPSCCWMIGIGKSSIIDWDLVSLDEPMRELALLLAADRALKGDDRSAIILDAYGGSIVVDRLDRHARSSKAFWGLRPSSV